jgi:hypothetical protein
MMLYVLSDLLIDAADEGSMKPGLSRVATTLISFEEYRLMKKNIY